MNTLGNGKLKVKASSIAHSGCSIVHWNLQSKNRLGFA